MNALTVAAVAAAQLSPVLSLRTSVQAAAHAWARESCEKNLWMTLDTCLKELDDNTSYVITGDIDAMWTRDSTAQVWPYLMMLEKHQEDFEQKTDEEKSSLVHLQKLLAGALRRQAKFILTDPYANAYTDKWEGETDRRLNRGGYVFTGNWEVDSGTYFMRFLTRMFELESKQKAGNTIFLQSKSVVDDPSSEQYTLLGDPHLRKAVEMMVATYRQERDHAKGKSHHRYPQSAPWELPGDGGEGNKAAYTGMVWGAFRPSDDPQQYAYNIPNNMFLASVLQPLSELAAQHWSGSEKLVASMQELRKTILDGVHEHGTTSAVKAGVAEAKAEDKVYCYEVDGLGNCLLMDDANVPSLLSLPYLDPTGEAYDKKMYESTRKFILSEKNPWYFVGKDGKGIGSPHTHENMIWPLAMVMQAMTATSQGEKNEVIANLYRVQAKSSAKNGLSESFNKDEASSITREWFAWPNALLAEHLMALKPAGCAPSLAALKQHLPKQVQKAKADGPLNELHTKFYLAPEDKLRRQDVVLPAEEYFNF